MIRYTCDICAAPIEAKDRLELATKAGRKLVGRADTHVCPRCVPRVVAALSPPAGNGKGKSRTTPKD
jgi:hypothetical protein